jgi:hypothetical protein
VTVAAAASAEPVSPELALVDATLAAQLRAIEAVEYPVETGTFPPDEDDPIADLIVQSAESPIERPAFEADEPTPTSDLTAEATGQREKTSWYPALPAPPGDGLEPMDATEAVLREIRDRLASPVPTKRGRRFRMRALPSRRD